MVEVPLFAGITTIALFLAIASIGLWRARRRSRLEASQFHRQYLEPVGKKAVQLKELITSQWRDTLSRQGPTPEVRWFPNLNVSARALVTGDVQTIAVSAGLWERAVRREDDPLVRIILLHEMAHLTYCDISAFRRLVLCANASRIIL